MKRDRWVAVSVELGNPTHRYHPHATGEPACRLGAWVDLLLNARWRDSGGLRRKQLRASQRFLSARWNWSRERVRRFLADLVENGSITITHERGRQPDIITIVNYDDYNPQQPTSKASRGGANEATNEATNEAKEVPVTNTKKDVPAFTVVKCGKCGASHLPEARVCPHCSHPNHRHRHDEGTGLSPVEMIQ